MAKTTGPLMSMAASGNFAGQIQFRGNRYGGHAYRPQPPARQNKQPPSPAQAAVRARYTQIRAEWWTLSEEQRNAWRDLADQPGILATGWNLFFAASMGLPESRTCYGGGPFDTPTGLVDGGNPFSIHDYIFDGGTP